jgi:isopenicillin N synthase-like dioxygenase
VSLTQRQLDVHKSPGFRGYNGLLSENTNPENDGDLHEGFNLGWEPEGATATEEIRDDGVMSGANAWPDPSQLPGFKEPVMAY